MLTHGNIIKDCSRGISLNYVADNVTRPYALLVTDCRVKYLESFGDLDVYFLDPWSGNKELIKINTWTATKNETITFDNVLEEHKKVVFITPHVHMMDKEIFTFLYTNTTNLAKDAEIAQYQYNSFYEGKNLYWPNIFVWEEPN